MSKTNGSPYPTLHRPATRDFLAAKPRPWRIIEVHTDPEAVEAWQAAMVNVGNVELELEQRRRSDSPPADDDRQVLLLGELRERLAEAEEAVHATSRQLLIVAAGKDVKERLLIEHPPTERDHEEERSERRKQFLGMLPMMRSESGSAVSPQVVEAAERQLAEVRAPYNYETYPLALIHASLREPDLSLDELRDLTSQWSDGEWATLWRAALEVNGDSTLVSQGKFSRSSTASNTTSA